MTWQWKLCAAILYMLPWVDVTEKTVYFIERFPALHWTEYFTGVCGCVFARFKFQRGSCGVDEARANKTPAWRSWLPCNA